MTPNKPSVHLLQTHVIDKQQSVSLVLHCTSSDGDHWVHGGHNISPTVQCNQRIWMRGNAQKRPCPKTACRRTRGREQVAVHRLGGSTGAGVLCTIRCSTDGSGAAVCDSTTHDMQSPPTTGSSNLSLVVNALMTAVWRRGKPVVLRHHSDQGGQAFKATAPAASSCATSSGEKPNSFNTSAVCSPTKGAMPSRVVGRSSKWMGQPIAR